MTSSDGPRVDIDGAPWRMLALFAGAIGFVALCAWLLVAAPDGRRTVEPGSLAAFVTMVGIVFFGAAGLMTVPQLLRRGPVVSVSARGIFDRRLSTDWIPWTAISGIDALKVGRQDFLRLTPHAQAEPSLPWTRKARLAARLNRPLGGGYWLAGQGVRGGTAAVLAAMERVMAPGGDPR